MSKPETFKMSSDHLVVEYECDEFPSIAISEADFTPTPLYVYLGPKEAAEELRRFAAWLDTLPEPEVKP